MATLECQKSENEHQYWALPFKSSTLNQLNLFAANKMEENDQ